ncbi:uncharacterized protein HMPREF1541_05606 [Cyphellophora europaea CBS 101466]|uniref:Uncharacterized protein n=1 Tax=Cyphellophora europaea (strain CBS 101466) TaxID=1220924 RepID=W2RUF8_CYPE1|nr:uncharacterized protein HMPREF1541_05606 [Cyphellophora europaea CBS 101466]ETN39383.1 hypothetical protein HMPREF1541_05606 [Cyphellophora europaea CBS 101466]
MPAESEGSDRPAKKVSAAKMPDSDSDSDLSSPTSLPSSPGSEAASSVGEEGPDARKNFIDLIAGRARQVLGQAYANVVQNNIAVPPPNIPNQQPTSSNSAPHQVPSSNEPVEENSDGDATGQEDDGTFNYPSPMSQNIPSAQEIGPIAHLRRRAQMYEDFGARDSFVNRELPSENPEHFTRRSTLHTKFFIKKVSTIQCDECKAKGKGEEIYKCSQCVKQICRSCMEGLLKRERQAQQEQDSNTDIQDGERDIYKWNWQGQYRHEGFKLCYLAREDANSKGNFQIDIPLYLLGPLDPDFGAGTVTIYMVRDNGHDDAPRKGTRRRRGFQLESDTSSEEAPPVARRRSPSKPLKKPAKKRQRISSSGSPVLLSRPAVPNQAQNHAVRQELSGMTSRNLQRLNRIQDAAATTAGRPLGPAHHADHASARAATAPLARPNAYQQHATSYAPRTQAPSQYGPTPTHNIHGLHTGLTHYAGPTAPNLPQAQQPAPNFVPPPPQTLIHLPDGLGGVQVMTWADFQRQNQGFVPFHAGTSHRQPEPQRPGPARPTRQVPTPIDTSLAQASEHHELNPEYEPRNLVRRASTAPRVVQGRRATASQRPGVASARRNTMRQAMAGFRLQAEGTVSGRQVAYLPFANAGHGAPMPRVPGPLVAFYDAMPYQQVVAMGDARWRQATQAGTINAARRPSAVTISSDEDDKNHEEEDAGAVLDAPEVASDRMNQDSNDSTGLYQAPSTPGSGDSVVDYAINSSPPLSTPQQPDRPSASTSAPPLVEQPRHAPALRPSAPKPSPLRNLLAANYFADDDDDADDEAEADDHGNDEDEIEVDLAETKDEPKAEDDSATIILSPNQPNTPNEPNERRQQLATGSLLSTARSPGLRSTRPPYYTAHHSPQRAEDQIRENRQEAYVQARFRQALRQLPESEELGLPAGPLGTRHMDVVSGVGVVRNNPRPSLHIDENGHASIITQAPVGGMLPPAQPSRGNAQAEPRDETEAEDEDDAGDDYTAVPASSPLPSEQADESSPAPASSLFAAVPPTPTRRTRSGIEYTGLGMEETGRVIRRTPRKYAGGSKGKGKGGKGNESD